MNKLTLRDLLCSATTYRPFLFEDFHQAFLKQHSMHWMASEISFNEDRNDFIKSENSSNNSQDALSQYEKDVVLRTLLFFTQADVEVGHFYRFILKHFQNHEVFRMATSFMSMETIHTDAYSALLEHLNIPVKTDTEFLKVKAMSDKYDYLQLVAKETFDDLLHNKESQMKMAKTIAIMSGAFEGFILYSSFAILFSFSNRRSEHSCPRLLGVGQVVEWSMRDESHHAHSMIKLFLKFCELCKFSNEEMQQLKDYIHCEFKKLVELENNFIDFIFAGESLPYLKPEEVKTYIKYLANLRLQQLQITPIFEENGELILQNNLKYMDSVLKLSGLINFFDNVSAEYGRNLNLEGINDDDTFC